MPQVAGELQGSNMDGIADCRTRSSASLDIPSELEVGFQPIAGLKSPLELAVQDTNSVCYDKLRLESSLISEEGSGGEGVVFGRVQGRGTADGARMARDRHPAR